MSNVIVVCVADRDGINAGKVNPLERSLQPHPLIILDTYQRGAGYLQKIALYMKYLKDTYDDDNDEDNNGEKTTVKHLYIFLDAFDTLCMQDPATLAQLAVDFVDTGKDVITSGEPRPYHQSPASAAWAREHNKARTGDAHYVNTGFLVGYRQALLSFFETLLNDSLFDPAPCPTCGTLCDQNRVAEYFAHLNGLDKIDCDIDCESTFIKTFEVNVDCSGSTQVTAYFAHVPWLANPIQRKKYEFLQRRESERNI